MAEVLAIDAGTSGVRALRVDDEVQVRAIAYRELPTSYPQPGWVEGDPNVIWQTICDVVRECLGTAPARLAAVGVVNQRASVVAWQKSTGEAIGPAIYWQDSRTDERVQELLASGIFASTMASSTKIEWLLRNSERGRELAARGDLRVGTLDSWIVSRLSDGEAHVTDSSNACCTGLYEPFEDRWDERVLDHLGIDIGVLPEIHPSSGVVATATNEIFGGTTPIAGIAGDQQAALFGHLGTQRGALKVTLGTAAMVDLNVGEVPILSERGALPLVLWNVAGRRDWCLEGTVVTAGASVQWLRDGLGVIESLAESAEVATSVPDAGGVWAMPAFQGLGTPHMKPNARARLGGLSRSSTQAHIVRAVLEGVAYRCCEVLDTLLEDAEVERPRRLAVDGGAAANDFLAQHLANVSGIPVERSECVQASALGGAFLAGLGVGVWQGADELAPLVRVERVFEPQWGEAERRTAFDDWRNETQLARGRDEVTV